MRPQGETSPAEPIRVLIVDDHEVVRVGLRSLVENHEQMEVVGEAATAAEAVELGLRLRPDVVIMDVRLPDQPGFVACREIIENAPATRVIMLTSYRDDEALFQSIAAGASGFLLKETRGRRLLDAIVAVHQGNALLDPVTTSKVLDRMRQGHREPHPIETLSEREMEILELIEQGATNREIAQQLHLSEKTVKHYVTNILSKLGVNRRVEAAAALARYRRGRKDRLTTEALWNRIDVWGSRERPILRPLGKSRVTNLR